MFKTYLYIVFCQRLKIEKNYFLSHFGHYLISACREILLVLVRCVTYAGLTIFTSVCIRWYGRQLITIPSLSATVPSKKQISGIGACSLIGVASSINCLSVRFGLSCFFSKLSNDYLS